MRHYPGSQCLRPEGPNALELTDRQIEYVPRPLKNASNLVSLVTSYFCAALELFLRPHPWHRGPSMDGVPAIVDRRKSYTSASNSYGSPLVPSVGHGPPSRIRCQRRLPQSACHTPQPAHQTQAQSNQEHSTRRDFPHTQAGALCIEIH